MESEGIPCQPGEIFLGVFIEKDAALIGANLLLRTENGFRRGVNKYVNVYVQRKELENFLLQAEMDLSEEKEKVDLQKKQLDAIRAIRAAEAAGEQFEDEAFIGSYPDVHEAQLAFACLQSIRGGGPAGPVAGTTEAGSLSEYHFFADRSEFEAFAAQLRAEALQNCENYKFMKIFYDFMKQFERL
jgi:hypothetical protein